MKDFRKNQGVESLDPVLVNEGEAQLQQEIAVLEQWLHGLDSEQNPALAPHTDRQTYLDMLRSRQDMLRALRKQTSQ